jgi:hypothetical protein
MKNLKVTPPAVVGIAVGLALASMSLLGLTGVLPLAEAYRPALYVGLPLGAYNIYRGFVALKQK